MVSLVRSFVSHLVVPWLVQTLASAPANECPDPIDKAFLCFPVDTGTGTGVSARQ